VIVGTNPKREKIFITSIQLFRIALA
jgi:hypothetical protein